MKLFTKMHLLAALEQNNLPHTYKSLLKMEREGIIPTSGGLEFSMNRQRLYTEEEINDIVSKVRVNKNDEK